MDTPRSHLVRGARELRAIVSSGRQEILDVLARMGDTTVAARGPSAGFAPSRSGSRSRTTPRHTATPGR